MTTGDSRIASTIRRCEKCGKELPLLSNLKYCDACDLQIANTNSVKEFQRQTDENAMRFIDNMGMDNLPKELRLPNTICNCECHDDDKITFCYDCHNSNGELICS